MMPSSQANYGRKPSTPKFEADPLNSTFRWEIYLAPDKPGNKVPILDGYSKGMGFENTNRIQLLMKKLQNPLLPYLSKSKEIVIYDNVKQLPKAYHPVLLELKPRDWQGYGWVGQDVSVGNFLDAYYQTYILTGKMPPQEDRRKNARQAFYLEELDHAKYNFRSQAELAAFCNRLTPKYSYTCMDDWYKAHAQYQPELFEDDLTGAIQAAINEAPTYEQAQAAQSLMGNMINQRTGRY